MKNSLKLGLCALLSFSFLHADYSIGSKTLKGDFPISDTNVLADIHGGTKTLEEAYSDGIGVVVINNDLSSQIDNSALNQLALKYAKYLKDSNMTLDQYVLENSTDEQELYLAKIIQNDRLNTSLPDGTSCDDANPNTSFDIVVNGTCKGVDLANLKSFIPGSNTLPYSKIIEDGTDPTYPTGKFSNMINHDGNTWWNYYQTADSGKRFGIIDMGSINYFDNYNISASSNRHFKTMDVYVGMTLDSMKLVSTVDTSSGGRFSIAAPGRYIKFHGHGTTSSNQPAVLISLTYTKY